MIVVCGWGDKSICPSGMKLGLRAVQGREWL